MITQTSQKNILKSYFSKLFLYYPFISLLFAIIYLIPFYMFYSFSNQSSFRDMQIWSNMKSEIYFLVFDSSHCNYDYKVYYNLYDYNSFVIVFIQSIYCAITLSASQRMQMIPILQVYNPNIPHFENVHKSFSFSLV